MDNGTGICFTFESPKEIVGVFRTIYAEFKNLGEPWRHIAHVISQNYLDGLGQKFDSIEAWELNVAACINATLNVQLGEEPRTYMIMANEVQERMVHAVFVQIPTDLCMDLLDLRIELSPEELSKSIRDYNMCKRLFLRLEADRCFGTYSGDCIYPGDSDALKCFSFRRNGPQRLIRPLEEGRAPWTADSAEPSELGSDENCIPNWLMTVDKPFAMLSEDLRTKE